MVISANRYAKLHIFIFALLSFHLFFYLQPPFIHKFLAMTIILGVILNIRKINLTLKFWYEILIAFLVNVYLTLAFFGYDLFLTHSVYNVRIMNILTFGIGSIWTGYVLAAFLNLLKWISNNKERFLFAPGGGYWKKWAVLFFIMFAIFGIWQIAYNPIVLSSDSGGYLSGWQEGTYNSFRSPLYAVLINVVCSLAPSEPEVLWIAVAQYFALSSLLSSVLMCFHKKWIRFKYIVPFAFFLPLIPSLGLHSIVVWSDMPCGMTMLWLTYIFVRIIDEMILHSTLSLKQQTSLCVQLCAAMVLSYFIRSNSFLVFLVMAPVLALLFALKKQRRPLAATLLSVAIVLLIRFPGYSALNVDTANASVAKYRAGIHDIQATYYGGGDLSEQTVTALRKYVKKLDDPRQRAGFRPDTARYLQQGYHYDFRELSMGEFATMYADSFIHNPFKMVKSMLFRVRAYWTIDPEGALGGTVNYTYIGEQNAGNAIQQAPELGVYRQNNIFTAIMDRYINFMVRPIPATFVWRYGIWVALMVISILTLILKKQYFTLLAYLPVFTYLASLYLSNYVTDYRYGLSVFLIGMFLPPLFLLSEPVETKRNLLNDQEKTDDG